MSKYIKMGSAIYLNDTENFSFKGLETRVYTVGCDQNNNNYLRPHVNFSLPDKIYGNLEKFSDKVLKTYYSRTSNTGVLLSGLKGTGKTLTMMQICIKSGLPIVVVPHAYTSANFINFITELEECVVVFEEFEKLYDTQEKRQPLLSLFDGIKKGPKKLFLLTSNNKFIGTYFENRTGRIFYHRQYGSLSEDLIKEIINDFVPENKVELRDALLFNLRVLPKVSFDIVKCLIDDCLLHDIMPKESIPDLNISMEDTSFNLTLTIKNKASGILYKKEYNDSTANPLGRLVIYDSYAYVEKETQPHIVEKIQQLRDEDKYEEAERLEEMSFRVVLDPSDINFLDKVEFIENGFTVEMEDEQNKYNFVYKKRNKFRYIGF